MEFLPYPRVTSVVCEYQNYIGINQMFVRKKSVPVWSFLTAENSMCFYIVNLKHVKICLETEKKNPKQTNKNPKQNPRPTRKL